MVAQACGRPAHGGNLAQAAVQPIKHGHHHAQNTEQQPRRHPGRQLPVDVAEAMPIVISGIEPHRDASSGFQIPRQALEGLFTIRRMMQHADAVDEVEALGSERESENVSLECHKLAIRQIACSYFRSGTKVDPHDTGSPAAGDLRESAHAATDIEDKLPLQVFRRKAGFPSEVRLGKMPACVIELGPVKVLPLVTEAIGVVLRLHETQEAAYHGKVLSARRTRIGLVTLLQRALATGTAQNVAHLWRQGSHDLLSRFQLKFRLDTAGAREFSTGFCCSLILSNAAV